MKPEQTTPGRFRRLQHPLVCVIVVLPPRQKAGSFGIDQALESLMRGAGDR